MELGMIGRQTGVPKKGAYGSNGKRLGPGKEGRN